MKVSQKAKKKKQIKTIHAKIRNKRLDDLHKASTEIAENSKLVVVGDFGAKNLAKTRMAKSIHDAGTSMFRNMLKYKASARGHMYIEVSEYLSTQICSSCEKIPTSAPKGVKDLEVREWVCSNCDVLHDRGELPT